MEKTKVLNKSDLQQALGLKGPIGKRVASLAYKLLELDEVNRIQAKYSDFSGPDFSVRVLQEVGVTWEVPENQLGYIPAEGPFITVSNHHYGAIDGLILSTIVGSKRSDYKILTNFILSLIPGLKESFMPVNPFSENSKKSFAGIRMALKHIADGHPLGFFPAGEVATYQKGDKRTAVGDKKVIEDKPWAENIIKIIKNAGIPVVPIYFDGDNSRTFHILGKIHPRLRTVRLVHELFNKRGRCVKVRIGQPILPEEIAEYDVPALGRYLRNRCYALEAQCVEHIDNTEAHFSRPVAEPEDPALFKEELARISDRMLFETSGYRCYLTPSTDIPHTMRELARLREETFRSIGEGTGNPLDTDSYDAYFHHLILYHIEDEAIAGAYRVGFGSDIVKNHGGIKGFYTASLFRYRSDSEPLLAKCMELGRTFIAKAYQKEIHSFKLLLSGLALTVMRHPELDYFLGPVSISNSFPEFYKSMMVSFLEKAFPHTDPIADNTTAFHPDFLRVDPTALMQFQPDNIDRFDRLLGAISDGRYRIPVLVSKYFKCSAKLICFNVDPAFNNALDGLILLKFTEYPENTLRTLVKFLPKEEQDKVFARFGKL